MDNNKAEQERKELNKKLLKDTFVSEYKSRKRVKSSEKFIEFFILFIAFSLSNFIVEMLSIDFWIIEVLIALVLVLGMQYAVSLITKKKRKDL